MLFYGQYAPNKESVLVYAISYDGPAYAGSTLLSVGIVYVSATQLQILINNRYQNQKQN